MRGFGPHLPKDPPLPLFRPPYLPKDPPLTLFRPTYLPKDLPLTLFRPPHLRYAHLDVAKAYGVRLAGQAQVRGGGGYLRRGGGYLKLRATLVSPSSCVGQKRRSDAPCRTWVPPGWSITDREPTRFRWPSVSIDPLCDPPTANVWCRLSEVRPPPCRVNPTHSPLRRYPWFRIPMAPCAPPCLSPSV